MILHLLKIWSILMNTPSAFEKKTVLCCWGEYSINVNWDNVIDSIAQIVYVLPKLCLLILPITEEGVLIFPTKLVDLSNSPCSSISFCFRYSKALLLGAYAFSFLDELFYHYVGLIILLVLEYTLFDIKYNHLFNIKGQNICLISNTLFDIKYYHSSFLLFGFCMIYCFSSFSFSIATSSNLKGFSCRQYIIGICFSIQFHKLCFNWPFIFNVIIAKEGYISLYFLKLCPI